MYRQAERFFVARCLDSRSRFTAPEFQFGPVRFSCIKMKIPVRLLRFGFAGARRSLSEWETAAGTERLVSGTRKCDRGLSQLLHADLHWLDVARRVRYKLVVTVHRCLHNKVPKYLADCCVPVLDIAGRQRLRSAHRHQLDVRTVLSTNYTRPSGVFCRWTNRLEFASTRAQRWDWEHFPAVTENTAFQTILVCSAH